MALLGPVDVRMKREEKKTSSVSRRRNGLDLVAANRILHGA